MANGKKFKIKFHFGKVSAIMIAVFAVLLTLDLVLKHCAVEYKWDFTVIPSVIEVVPMRPNTGAAFSFLADTEWGRIFLIVLTFVLLIAIIIGFALLPERFIILKLVLAMIASGALGNLIDRLALGYVRDFVCVNMIFSMPCCNFADFWIVIGAVIGVVDFLFLDEFALIPLTKRAKAAAAEDNEAERASLQSPAIANEDADNVTQETKANTYDKETPNGDDGEAEGDKDKDKEE